LFLLFFWYLCINVYNKHIYFQILQEICNCKFHKNIILYIDIKMETEKQYFDNSDLEKYFIVDVNVPNEDLVSSDTYNETELKNNFIQIEDNGRQLLYISALHVAIIGSGNKVLGAIRYKNNVHQIKDILDKHKILYNKNINEKYDKKKH